MRTGSAALRARGNMVEEASERYLQQQGLQAIERNFNRRGGEIDLVMRDGETLVFVEVRFRKSDRFGTPAESITASKNANYYKPRNCIYWRIQCGVISPVVLM